ncbi:phage protein NinX family protein [Citrobacter braakii]|uniref:phage protein NinX family protein n=1 Tax=Citrobacter braakii TaxID=57706 RepID=UPI000544372E|nr:phage protein NinX family protein [Citrobacter braakii]KHE11760.1 hypothetical protein LH87_18420 [Citrobacter braakii]
MDYSKLSDQEINGLVMDAISDGNQAYRGGNGSAIELLHQINTVEFGEHVEREEVYAKFDPCNNPSDAWPIIEKYRISFLDQLTEWCVDAKGVSPVFEANPLRGAMIVFLMMQEVIQCSG